MYDVYLSQDQLSVQATQAVSQAVAKFVESNLDEATINAMTFQDWEGQLNNYGAFVGYAGNAHEAADGFVFDNSEDAHKFLGELKYALDGTGVYASIAELA